MFKIGADNRQDPLNDTETRARDMMRAFGKIANQAPVDVVVAASINLLINAIRGAHGSRDAALRRYDQLTSEMRGVLASHYDGVGRRRNVFPFDQHIQVPLIGDVDKVRGN